jgi:hypothetical protein
MKYASAALGIMLAGLQMKRRFFSLLVCAGLALDDLSLSLSLSLINLLVYLSFTG